MKCPDCNSLTRTVDSRERNRSRWRRRECPNCKLRFTTVELLVGTEQLIDFTVSIAAKLTGNGLRILSTTKPRLDAYQWCANNPIEVAKYPDSLVAIHPDKGVVAVAKDPTEFVTKLLALSMDDRERVLVLNTAEVPRQENP